jgi:hypothetical protein
LTLLISRSDLICQMPITLRSLLLPGALIALAASPSFGGTVVYSALSSPLPYNVTSLGYQATRTAELGDWIQFAGGATTLETATILLSDWAKASTYSASTSGFDVPITLNLFNVDSSSGTAQPGSLIASVTQTFLIPWRPEASPGCAGDGWMAPDGVCRGGMSAPVVFNLAGIAVPSEIIFGVAFDTQSAGNPPLGVTGPYNSLNVGLSSSAPVVGSKPAPGTLYWNTTNPGYYTDGGAGGTGTFRQDTNWNYAVAAEFSAASTPEPGSMALALGGLLLAAVNQRRLRRNRAK